MKRRRSTVRIRPKPNEARLSKRRFRRDETQHPNIAPSPLGELIGLLREPGGTRGLVPLKDDPQAERERAEATRRKSEVRLAQEREIEWEVWRKYGCHPDCPPIQHHTGTPMRLPEGGWGVRILADGVRLGDIVAVKPLLADPWDAEVIEIVWSGRGCANVRTGTPGVAAKVEIRKRLKALDKKPSGEPTARSEAPRRVAKARRAAPRRTDNPLSGDQPWTP